MRRYKGVAAWPTRYVAAGLVLSTLGALAALLGRAVVPAVLLGGIAVRAGRELSRRRKRG